MSNAARNEVLSSFGETINNSLAEMDRQKASKTPFHPIFPAALFHGWRVAGDGWRVAGGG